MRIYSSIVGNIWTLRRILTTCVQYYRAGTGRFTSEDSIEKATRKLPNDQEVTDPLSLNKYTYCYNNPTFYSDPSGHFALPFFALAGIAGTIAGALTGAISSALQGKFSGQAVMEGAVIGGMIGFTGGAILAYGAAGSAIASTGAVMAGLGFGAATLGSAGTTGFEQARQLVQRNPVVEDISNKYAFGLKGLVKGFAKDIGAQQFMGSTQWQADVWNAFNDPIAEIHFLLDGVDQTLMQMMTTPERSGINWELNLLYQLKDVFAKTIFHYYGEIYIGAEAFKIKP